MFLNLLTRIVIINFAALLNYDYKSYFNLVIQNSYFDISYSYYDSFTNEVHITSDYSSY